MPGTAVIGLQWGDEAKGKIVDILTAQQDVVVRYQGGANAGHTVVFNGQRYKLSLIPSGVFHPNVQCVIAGGVVCSPSALLAEIDTLVKLGVNVGKNLLISDRAHIIFPWHKIEDAMFDNIASGEAIGTTMRGIGPCYQDKYGRSLAVRFGDLYKPDFEEKIQTIAGAKNRLFNGLIGETDNSQMLPGIGIDIDAGAVFREYKGYADRLEKYVTDTTAYLLDAVDADKRILFEGAQGSLLDVDHGTFPYVTSSNSSAVGVCSGAGVPPHFIKKYVGIIKAYTTRVGGGPFPTELANDTGQCIRDRGKEYGTVTKRPRRCGWFDAVAARYTVRLGGIDTLAVMLLDVLSTFDELKICTAYTLDGSRVTAFPSHVDDLRRVEAIYETLPGWHEDITEVRQFSDLPLNAQNYLKRISGLIGKPIEMVSVGPGREQTIMLQF
ncbi:MAG: adenylosuccinate synthase [Planctomycetaceae bacterium]|jgi:adenylosuccinate synthase|nr:adenylosuccinate synthase [Planctomycetaceae bacterium]